MNVRPLGRDEVRQIDRRAIEEFGLPGVVLMENAGRNAADLLARQRPAGPVLICCGKGNNGGDGMVMARHLDRWGYDVRVLIFADPAELRGDAATNYQVIAAAGVPIVPVGGTPPRSARLVEELQPAGWVVDGLLGTGLSGTVRSPLAEVIEALNACGRPVFAIDIPSGLDCDTGRPLGAAVRAAMTATFVASKKGFSQAGAEQYTGAVHVLDIGVPRRLLEPWFDAPDPRA